MEKLVSFVKGYELNKMDLFRIVDGGCDALLNDAEGEVFELTGVEIDGRENADGKMKYRSILFAKDGKSYATASTSVKVKLDRIIDVFGLLETWETPLKVMVIKEQIRGVRNPVLSLKLV